MHPILTLFVAFTRRWALEQWLDNLTHVEHDPALTNLCVIVDIDDPYILKVFKAFSEKHSYRSLHMKINEDWNPNEVRLTIRRQRVATVKNQSKELVALTDGEIILGFEDDTVFDRLPSFQRLYQPLLDDKTVGFVEGVQMGRWGVNIIGAWDCDDYEYPQKVWTLLPLDNPEALGPRVAENDYEEISGGGFYGYATTRELYMKPDYYWATSQPWGPDVNFGLWLRNQGYKCLIDWQTVYGHNDHNQVRYPDNLPNRERLAQVIYTKDLNTMRWERVDNEPSRY